jgi:hypothetical protein
MAKELPYFKFEPNQWENGNIQMLSREDKGLFIDLCSMYWSRLGDVPEKLVIQKLCAGNALALNSLCEEKIIEVINSKIFIKFLSEQLNEFEDTSKQNSKNAKERWEKHRKQKDESERNASALNSQCESDAIREEKIKEDKIITTTEIINFDDAVNICLFSEQWKEDIERLYKIDRNKIQFALQEFKLHCGTTGDNKPRSLNQFKKHFTNWVRVKKQYQVKTINKDRL